MHRHVFTSVIQRSNLQLDMELSLRLRIAVTRGENVDHFNHLI